MDHPCFGFAFIVKDSKDRYAVKIGEFLINFA